MNIPNVNHLFKSGTMLLSKNAPALLTAFGAVGVVSTAVLTAKATQKSYKDIFAANQQITEARELEGMQYDPNIYLSRTDEFKLVWLNYLPAVTSGALSISAIVLSHRISSRRAAVLAAAYALNEKKLEEYQDKIKEKFGVKKADEVKTEMHQDKIDKTYDEGTVIFSPLDGKVLIMEAYTGRFFWSTIDEVNKAVNEVNHEVIREGSVRLSEFYDTLGLEHVSTSDHFGFNQHTMMELSWDTGTTPDGKTPVHTFEYVDGPIMNPGDAAFR